MRNAQPLLGGVELGGTKCICSIGTAPGDIRGHIAVPTGSDPQKALHRIVDQMNAWAAIHGPIAALGIASFGPVDLDMRSSTYGFITSTSKPGWRFVDVAGPLARAFGVPTGFDTDVNGAALAEGRWGAARELRRFRLRNRRHGSGRRPGRQRSAGLWLLPPGAWPRPRGKAGGR